MKLKLQDILMVGITAVLFGVVFLGAVYAATPVVALLSPFGLSSLGYEPFYGIWFMAAAFALYVIRKPGVGVVAEVLGAIIETLMGNFFGPMVIVSGLVQGLGFELVFAATGYKRFNVVMLALASTICSCTTMVYNYFVSGYAKIDLGIIVLMLAVRVISALLFSTGVVHFLTKRLAKAGVLNAYAAGHDLHV